MLIGPFYRWKKKIHHFLKCHTHKGVWPSSTILDLTFFPPAHVFAPILPGGSTTSFLLRCLGQHVLASRFRDAFLRQGIEQIDIPENMIAGFSCFCIQFLFYQLNIFQNLHIACKPHHCLGEKVLFPGDLSSFQPPPLYTFFSHSRSSPAANRLCFQNNSGESNGPHILTYTFPKIL